MKKIIQTSSVLPHLHYEPDVIDGNRQYPLIIYLHGVGERGNNPQLIEKYCLPKYILQGLNLESFIYAPQCPANKRWEDITGKIILGIEEYLIRHRVNKSEITITGFSMGGQGLWKLAVENPELFYKIVAVSGRIPERGNLFTKLSLIKDKAIWIFHSNNDKEVDVNNSLSILNELQSLGATKLKYTFYDSLSHGETADKTYSDPCLYEWILR